MVILFFSACKKEKVSERPNILWIQAEDLSPHLGCYGDENVHTPTIDLLAKEGVMFTRAFTNAGVCAPSRAAIITGMHSTFTGTQHMRQAKSVLAIPGIPNYNAVPQLYVKAFPEYLRAGGYYTCNNRKTDYQFGEPFSVWDECSKTAHWRNRPEGKPFFANFVFESTHEINVWPDSTKARFFDEFYVDTAKLVNDVKFRPPLDKKYFTHPDSIELPPYYPDTKIIREDIARFYTNISRMDGQVKRLLEQLEEDGLLDNTIIFFMGDHGDCLPRRKRWVLDSGTQIPLIIWWPSDISAGTREDLVSGIDLAPTVLAMAGIEIPEHIHGKDIFGELEENPNKYVFAYRDRMDDKYDMIRSVRNNRFRYIQNFDPDVNYTQPITFMYQMPMMQEILRLNNEGNLNETQSYWLFNTKPDEELYLIEADPYEINNIASDPEFHDVLLELRTALETWQLEYDLWAEIEETEQAEQMWPEGIQPVTEAPLISIHEESKRIRLSCGKEGASIGYRFSTSGKPNEWTLYTKPFHTDKSDTLFVKSIRYGFAESEVVAEFIEK